MKPLGYRTSLRLLLRNETNHVSDERRKTQLQMASENARKILLVKIFKRAELLVMYAHTCRTHSPHQKHAKSHGDKNVAISTSFFFSNGNNRWSYFDVFRNELC